MKSFQHPTNNFVFSAPQDWDQKKLACAGLPVTKGTSQGYPVIVSYWRPDAEELAALNAGKAVTLSIIGNGMPPVALGVES